MSLAPDGAAYALEDFYVPSRQAATFPWSSHAAWFYAQMVRWKQVEFSAEHLAAARATYRPDLYRAALAPLNVDVPLHDAKVEGSSPQAHTIPSTAGRLRYGPDGFFDNRMFDPDDLRAYLPDCA